MSDLNVENLMRFAEEVLKAEANGGVAGLFCLAIPHNGAPLEIVYAHRVCDTWALAGLASERVANFMRRVHREIPADADTTAEIDDLLKGRK